MCSPDFSVDKMNKRREKEKSHHKTLIRTRNQQSSGVHFLMIFAQHTLHSYTIWRYKLHNSFFLCLASHVHRDTPKYVQQFGVFKSACGVSVNSYLISLPGPYRFPPQLQFTARKIGCK